MKIDTKLEELGDRLERSAAADLRSEQRNSGAVMAWARQRRSRLLASSSLGLAGIGAAVLIVLSGTAATPSAFAITKHGDGSVLVQLSAQEDIAQANQKLASMGINEQITLYSNPRPTASSRPENCTPGPGAGVPNPPIKLVVNTDNADNTGTTGAVVCVVGPHTYSGPYPGTSGDTGSRNSGSTTAALGAGRQSCLRDQKTGEVVRVIFPSAAAQRAAVGTGKYVPSSNAGNTGGPPNNDTFVVVTCSIGKPSKRPSGNTVKTGTRLLAPVVNSSNTSGTGSGNTGNG